MQVLSGFWLTKSACVAVQMAIPDLLGDMTVPVEDLASQASVDEQALYRMLRALTCVGIFEETAPRQFANSEMSHRLREDSPQSLKALFLLTGEEWKWASWGKLSQIIRQGHFVLNELYGHRSIFEFFASEPDRGAVFNEAMSRHAVVVHAASLDAYDFSAAGNVIDIGGGQGAFLATLLSCNPEMRGVLFDQEHVVDKAGAYFSAAGVSHRASIVAGNFFDGVPGQGDIYVLGMIMHDWGDQDCLRILSNICSAMKPSSKLVLLEYVVPEGNQPHFSKILDMEMLITYRDGRERTEAEFRALLEASGLELTRTIPTTCGSAAIEAVPRRTE